MNRPSPVFHEHNVGKTAHLYLKILRMVSMHFRHLTLTADTRSLKQSIGKKHFYEQTRGTMTQSFNICHLSCDMSMKQAQTYILKRHLFKLNEKMYFWRRPPVCVNIEAFINFK